MKVGAARARSFCGLAVAKLPSRDGDPCDRRGDRDRERPAEGRREGNPEDLRADEGIAKQSLKCGATDRKPPPPR
jgi:hypothetical protein